MSEFIEIGEIVEVIPEPLSVIEGRKVPGTNNSSPTEPNDSNGNTFKWFLAIALIVGFGYVVYRINKKKDEDIIARHKP